MPGTMVQEVWYRAVCAWIWNNSLNRLHNALLIYAQQTMHKYINDTQRPYSVHTLGPMSLPQTKRRSWFRINVLCRQVKADIIIRDMLVHTKRLFNMSRKIKVPTQSRPMQPIQSNQGQVHHFATFTLTAQSLSPHKHQSFCTACMLFGRCLYD